MKTQASVLSLLVGISTTSVSCDNTGKGDIDGHALAQTHGQLVALTTACGVLIDSELATSCITNDGAAVVADGQLRTCIFRQYAQSRPAPLPVTGITDVWGSPIELSFTQAGAVTNGSGKVDGLIRVTARSYGPNRHRELSNGDDLILEVTNFVPNWNEEAHAEPTLRLQITTRPQ